MSSLTNALLRKILIGVAHHWIWSWWIEHQWLPHKVVFTVHDKDIELQPFNGKRVKIVMFVEDDKEKL